MSGIDDSRYFLQNVVPIGEEELHTPFPGCKCVPEIREKNGTRYLFHYSFDKREVWLAIEKELGMTCYEHGRPVDDTYEKGHDHRHYPWPKKVFEYPHKQIDPR